MNIKGAIFDMDGTLVDSLGGWEFIYTQIGNKYLGKPLEVSAEFDIAVRTVTFREATEMIYNEFHLDESGEKLYEYTQHLLPYYYEHYAKLKEGVVEYLEYLKQNNVKMCIASATLKSSVEYCLEKFGIDKYFEDVVSCFDVGKSKEFPDVFIEAQKVLGTDMNETWVFEDSLVALKSAIRAGFRTVGVYDKFNYGHEEMKQIVTEYVGENETLTKLIDE